MKRHLARILIVLAVAVLAGGAWVAWRINEHPPLKAYHERLLPTDRGNSSLRVTFLGVSTLLFDDGEHAILTDGFFTRPDLRTVTLGKVAPDPERIARSLQRAGITRLDAVIVVHSHFDHVMDAPEVARRTGALVVGSVSTANVARGWGLPEQRIRIARSGDRFRIGSFEVTLIGSRHVPTGFTGGEIAAPLVPPVRATRYLEGDSFSVLIAHGGRSILVQSSAGFVGNALRGHHADVVFLGIGMLGRQGDDYRNAYWNETVRTVGARRVIPIHWDDFTLPLDRPLVPFPALLDDVGKSMDFLDSRARAEGVDLRFAPVWERVDPFAGL